jgi:dCMP deaminase
MNLMNWDQYALCLAKVASLKSKDPYVKVGCCLLRHDNTVASLGYNGFPAGMKEEWSNRDERRKYVNHAESNALRFVKPNECYLAAVTLLPCNDCLKSLASYGIKKIVYSQTYDKDSSSENLAQKFGIEIVKIDIHDLIPRNFF